MKIAVKKQLGELLDAAYGDGRVDLFVAELEADGLAVVDASTAAVADATERVDAAMELIWQFGGIDGDHHRAWLIDQVARKLLGLGYADWVAARKAGEDGPDTYGWAEGIAP